LFPLPLGLISLSCDGIRPTVVKDNRLFTANVSPLEVLVPSEGTSNPILASKLYGKIGQQTDATYSILVYSTINTLSHKKVAKRVPDAFIVVHR
jgi:hypothetical protein